MTTPPSSRESGDSIWGSSELDGGPGDTVPVIAFNPYRTLKRDGNVTSGYADRPVVDALHGPTGNKEPLMVTPVTIGADPMLPDGLDSHRYRCCGNGVVSSVAEWIGIRLLAALPATGRPR